MANSLDSINSFKSGLKKNTMLLVLLLVMVVFHFAIILTGKSDSGFFSPQNISNLISQNAYVLVLASGMLLCILTGGNIDLSVGSVVALVGGLAGVFIVSWGMPLIVAVILCLIAGLLIGAWHGFWIAYVRIPPFITTLAGMLLWRGVALIILDGKTISPFPTAYKRFFTSFLPATENRQTIMMATLVIGVILCAIFVVQTIRDRARKIKKEYAVDTFGMFIFKLAVMCAVILAVSGLLSQNKGIPVALIWVAVVVGIYGYFTSRTVPGRYLYALGGNEKAAKMSGIDTNKMYFFAYANMGFLAAVAALMCVARFDSAAPSAGTNYELDAIGSCFIGGASAYGGTGTVSGAVVGAVFMGVLNQGMSILGVDANWQRAVKGIVLLAAVVFDVMSKNKKKHS